MWSYGISHDLGKRPFSKGGSRCPFGMWGLVYREAKMENQHFGGPLF